MSWLRLWTVVNTDHGRVCCHVHVFFLLFHSRGHGVIVLGMIVVNVLVVVIVVVVLIGVVVYIIVEMVLMVVDIVFVVVEVMIVVVCNVQCTCS